MGMDKEEYRPLISIITQVLNGVRYLEECIQSVLNQSYPNIEHIFIDGGSTDGTVEVLSNYKAKYPDRIKFISEPDESPTDAWNKGWKMAKGGIFGWLGADDTYKLDDIQAVVEFFEANPEAYFVFGDCDIINEEGEVIGRRETKAFDLGEIINGATIPSPSASFYRREVIRKVGLMDTRYQEGSEFDYWIRVSMRFPMHRIDKVFSNFRAHTGKKLSNSKGANTKASRQGFDISRGYGGRLFSPIARRYFRFLIIDKLRPVLGFTYPIISKIKRR